MTQSRILIVDDEPGLLLSCKAILEDEFAVSTAGSGEQALQMLSETAQGWDLMLLDLNMPGLDGLAVMDELHKRGLDISVVVLSGETAFHWVSRAFQLGAFDYISKPYEADALINTIRNALKKRELEKDFIQLRRQLERSERLHRFMIESSPDIIFIVDKEGIFRFVNDRAEEMLAYRKDELIGHHYSVIVDPASIAKAANCFNERRISVRAARDEEIWLLCKPGAAPNLERRRIAIELNAMGVYENETVNEKGERLQRDYSGTYVVARDVTERLASQKLIHYQAYHDLLTGLPNRALFMDRLTTAINVARRQNSKLAVMFLDLDRFKFVNDSLGHDTGDALLKSVAERLKRCLRDCDTLARIGGDEFVVLLQQVESLATAKSVADKIVRSIKEPLTIAHHELCVTTSVGIALYPDDGTTAEALIKNADIAMYHTKELGKDGFSVFTRELSEQQKEHLSIETEIRRGIRDNQFEVYYQPQVNALDGRIIGVEALLRWNHPERGLLTPAFFLAVAEESALMIELGDWVVEAALSDVKAWRNAGLDAGKLAVNFSFRQIEQADFVAKIVGALRRFDYPGELFEIEITESALMSDSGKTIDKLRQLNAYRVNIAIDDFGTGYSSLSLLQKLPLNRLKIDRSFIQGLRSDSDRSIIEAIAHMAKGLKLDMVAEGVEQDYQLRYLRKLQCPVIQGFIYSHCLPAEAMRKLLEERATLTARSGRILHSV